MKGLARLLLASLVLRLVDRLWKPSIAYAHAAVFTPVFNKFRFYNDGTESGSSPWANEDVNVTVKVGAGNRKIHLRVRIQETGAANGATTDDYQLQYSKNAGSYTNVTGSSSNVRSDTASSLTADGTTTNRATNGIADGTGSFVAGEQEETNGLIEDRQLTASNFTEHVWALELVAADLANNDTLDFRISLNGGSPGMTNSVVPRITVNKGATENLNVRGGSYTGNGGADQSITHGGSTTPKVLIVKRRAAEASYLRTSAMAADSAKPMGGGTFVLGLITALGSTSFTVDGGLNTNLEVYDWVAFFGAEAEAAAFTYTGTGVDGQFIDCGFTPDWFLTFSDSGDSTIWRSVDMTGDFANWMDGRGLTNFHQAFEAGGAQLGSDAQVNTNGTTYYAIAIKKRAGIFNTKKYPGNGLDNTSISGAGFQPQFLWVNSEDVNRGVMLKFKDQTGDSSQVHNGAPVAGYLQAFETDGMQVSEANLVNGSGEDYFVIWARAAVAVSLVPDLRRSQRAMRIR